MSPFNTGDTSSCTSESWLTDSNCNGIGDPGVHVKKSRFLGRVVRRLVASRHSKRNTRDETFRNYPVVVLTREKRTDKLALELLPRHALQNTSSSDCFSTSMASESFVNSKTSFSLNNRTASRMDFHGRCLSTASPHKLKSHQTKTRADFKDCRSRFTGTEETSGLSSIDIKDGFSFKENTCTGERSATFSNGHKSPLLDSLHSRPASSTPLSEVTNSHMSSSTPGSRSSGSSRTLLEPFFESRKTLGCSSVGENFVEPVAFSPNRAKNVISIARTRVISSPSIPKYVFSPSSMSEHKTGVPKKSPMNITRDSGVENSSKLCGANIQTRKVRTDTEPIHDNSAVAEPSSSIRDDCSLQRHKRLRLSESNTETSDESSDDELFDAVIGPKFPVVVLSRCLTSNDRSDGSKSHGSYDYGLNFPKKSPKTSGKSPLKNSASYIFDNPSLTESSSKLHGTNIQTRKVRPDTEPTHDNTAVTEPSSSIRNDSRLQRHKRLRLSESNTETSDESSNDELFDSVIGSKCPVVVLRRCLTSNDRSDGSKSHGSYDYGLNCPKKSPKTSDKSPAKNSASHILDNSSLTESGSKLHGKNIQTRKVRPDTEPTHDNSAVTEPSSGIRDDCRLQRHKRLMLSESNTETSDESSNDELFESVIGSKFPVMVLSRCLTSNDRSDGSKRHGSYDYELNSPNTSPKTSGKSPVKNSASTYNLGNPSLTESGSKLHGTNIQARKLRPDTEPIHDNSALTEPSSSIRNDNRLRRHRCLRLFESNTETSDESSDDQLFDSVIGSKFPVVVLNRCLSSNDRSDGSKSQGTCNYGLNSSQKSPKTRGIESRNSCGKSPVKNSASTYNLVNPSVTESGSKLHGTNIQARKLRPDTEPIHDNSALTEPSSSIRNDNRLRRHRCSRLFESNTETSDESSDDQLFDSVIGSKFPVVVLNRCLSSNDRSGGCKSQGTCNCGLNSSQKSPKRSDIESRNSCGKSPVKNCASSYIIDNSSSTESGLNTRRVYTRPHLCVAAKPGDDTSDDELFKSMSSLITHTGENPCIGVEPAKNGTTKSLTQIRSKPKSIRDCHNSGAIQFKMAMKHIWDEFLATNGRRQPNSEGLQKFELNRNSSGKFWPKSQEIRPWHNWTQEQLSDFMKMQSSASSLMPQYFSSNQKSCVDLQSVFTAISHP